MLVVRVAVIGLAVAVLIILIRLTVAVPLTVKKVAASATAITPATQLIPQTHYHNNKLLYSPKLNKRDR